MLSNKFSANSAQRGRRGISKSVKGKMAYGRGGRVRGGRRFQGGGHAHQVPQIGYDHYHGGMTTGNNPVPTYTQSTNYQSGSAPASFQLNQSAGNPLMSNTTQAGRHYHNSGISPRGRMKRGGRLGRKLETGGHTHALNKGITGHQHLYEKRYEPRHPHQEGFTYNQGQGEFHAPVQVQGQMWQKGDDDDYGSGQYVPVTLDYHNHGTEATFPSTTAPTSYGSPILSGPEFGTSKGGIHQHDSQFITPRGRRRRRGGRMRRR